MYSKVFKFYTYKSLMQPIERLKKKVLIENLWIFILRLLKSKDYYGFEIRNKIKKEFGFLIGNVTAYKVFYLLEKDGYVTSFTKGNIKYYRITNKGKKELDQASKFLKSLTK